MAVGPQPGVEFGKRLLVCQAAGRTGRYHELGPPACLGGDLGSAFAGDEAVAVVSDLTNVGEYDYVAKRQAAGNTFGDAPSGAVQYIGKPVCILARYSVSL
jgi:hypothetical protein